MWCSPMELALQPRLESKLGPDMAASKELNQQFITHMQNSNQSFRSDFSIHVLVSGRWPFKQSSELKLPQELERRSFCNASSPLEP